MARTTSPPSTTGCTSDALHDEIAYGASKAALDRIVLAAAREFGSFGVTANLVNPGPIDTGWTTDEAREALLAHPRPVVSAHRATPPRSWLTCCPRTVSGSPGSC